MQITTFIAIYFVVWWLCLFLVLPFGVRNQSDVGEYVQGSERGAPARLRLWPKLIWTTALSVPMTGLLLWALSTPWLREYWQ